MTDAAVLSEEIQQQQQTVNFAQPYVKLEQARYETGIDPYLAILVAQTTMLADSRL